MKNLANQSIFQRTVVCPTCSGESVYSPSNPFRPFCSDRCKQMDLGAWAAEDFRVPAKSIAEDMNEDPGQSY